MSLDLGNPLKHHLFRLKFTELNEIYFFMVIRAFALSLIAIFIPIYLYKSDYGLQNIFLLYLFIYLFEFIFEYLGARFLKIRGPKHAIILSIPFTIIHFWQLFSIETYHWPPILLAIPLSFGLAFFWQGYHYDFSRSKHTSKATKEVGKTYIAIAIISSLAPFLGGVLGTALGMNKLLLVVIFLLAIGSIILLKTKDNNFRKGTLDFTKIKLKDVSNQTISYSGLGWETVSALVIWPLFIYLIKRLARLFKTGSSFKLEVFMILAALAIGTIA